MLPVMAHAQIKLRILKIKIMTASNELRELLELHRKNCIDLVKETDFCKLKNKKCTRRCERCKYWRDLAKNYYWL